MKKRKAPSRHHPDRSPNVQTYQSPPADTILDRFFSLEEKCAIQGEPHNIPSREILDFLDTENSRAMLQISMTDDSLPPTSLGEECAMFLDYFDAWYRPVAGLMRKIQRNWPDAPLVFRIGASFRAATHESSRLHLMDRQLKNCRLLTDYLFRLEGTRTLFFLEHDGTHDRVEIPFHLQEDDLDDMEDSVLQKVVHLAEYGGKLLFRFPSSTEGIHIFNGFRFRDGNIHKIPASELQTFARKIPDVEIPDDDTAILQEALLAFP